MASAPCRFCATKSMHTMTATTVVPTEFGPVTLTVCPVCDRRRCAACSQCERTGMAARCPSCGADLRLPAQ